MNKFFVLGLLAFLSLSVEVMGGTIQGMCEEADCTYVGTIGPLPNVPITLFDSGTNTVIANVICDQAGTFEFTSVPIGDYYVESTTITPTGYRFASLGSVLVTIPAAGTIVNVGAFRQISRNCYGDIVGTCEEADCTGTTIQPIDIPVGVSAANGDVVATTTCGSTGTYVFTGILAGNYDVQSFNLPGFFSAVGSPDTVPVTLPQGGQVRVDFIDTSVQCPGGIAGTCKEANCIGTIDPLQDVTITLCDVNGNPLASTTCDASGEFVFSDVPANDYIVKSIDLPGFTSVSPNTVPISVPAGSPVSGVSFVDYVPYGLIKGTVVIGVDCEPLDGDEPNAGCTIELCDINNPLNPCETAITSATGNYEFPCVPLGEYTVRQVDCLGGRSDSDGGDPDIGTVTVSSAGSTVTHDFVDYLAEWWDKVSSNYQGRIIDDLKCCKDKQPMPNPPIHGMGCSQFHKTCYFGNDRACPFGPSPTMRCFCDGGLNIPPGILNPTQTWDCQSYSCPVSASHVYD